MTMPKYKLPASILGNIQRAMVNDDYSSLNTIDINLAELMQAEERETAFTNMSPHRRAFLATFEAESHVNSSGFDAMFSYMSDEMLAEVAPAYRLFNAPSFADLVESAIAKFPTYPPIPNPGEREVVTQAWMDDGVDPFQDLFDKFIEIGAATVERMRFVSEHPSEFFAS